MPEKKLYLEAHSLDAIQRALFAALSRVRKQDRAFFGYNSLVDYLVTELFDDDGRRSEISHQLADRQKLEWVSEDSDTRKIMTALWGLVSDGILYPRFNTDNSREQFVLSYFGTTERGDRVLDSRQSHPLSPTFIDHLKREVPLITNDVLSHLEDASECLRRGLLRAAVVMIGLAAEETVRITLEALINLGKLTGVPSWKAVNQLAQLKTVAEAWLHKEEKHQMTIAVLAFEAVRRQRNGAAHPGAVRLEHLQIESLLTLTASHIPVMWKIPIQQAVNNGFIIPAEV